MVLVHYLETEANSHNKNSLKKLQENGFEVRRPIQMLPVQLLIKTVSHFLLRFIFYAQVIYLF